MKLKLLLFSIVLNFTLIKVVSSNNDNKLMLVGFGNYNYANDKITFNILFKKYNNNISYTNASITFFLSNGTSSYDKNINRNCTNTNERDDEVVYNYTFVSPIVNVSQVKLENTNFIFYNQLGNEIHETKIIESSLAKDMKNNIQSQVNPLNISTFYFVNFTQINDDKVVINGTVEPDINEGTYILNLSKKNYSCSVDDKSIIFNLSNSNINDNLIGKVLFHETEDQKILIFSNEASPNDLLMYSTVKSSSVDLYGFENYNKSENGSAENVAVFFGTSNILKKYLRFTTKIRYGSNSNSTLRFLDEKTTNVTVTGTLISESTDIDNGVFKYKNVFPGTENISNILGIDSWNDYEFSDDNVNFNRAIVIIISDYINLTNEGKLENPVFINFTEYPKIDGNTLSFNLNLNPAILL